MNHSECINYKRECPEDMLGLVRDTPLDDPLLLYPAPMPKETILNPNPLPPWPLKHHGQVFRACSEGDVVLVKRLIREWKEAKELEDDDDEPTDEVSKHSNIVQSGNVYMFDLHYPPPLLSL